MHYLKKSLFLWLGILFLVGVNIAQAQETPLVPREILMGNPMKSGATLSPNGQWYAYLAPSTQGVLNIWLQDLKQTQAPIMLTHDTGSGIHNLLWAKDSNEILYLQDSDGNANNHLYSIDINAKTIQDLTPYKGVRAQNIVVNKNYPEQILVELNQRNPQFFDVYRINLLTKQIKLDTQNPGDVEDWLADANMQVRAAVANNDKDGSSVLRTRLNSQSPWRNLITWPFGESGSAITFNQQGDKLTLISTLGSDTARLVEIDANTGKLLKILAQNPQSDVSNVMTNGDTNQVEAVQFDYLRPEWQVIDPAIKADFATLNAVNKGVFIVTSHDSNNQLWTVGYYSDTNPGSIYLYDRTTKKLQLLFNTRPALQNYTLATMQPVIIPARDGTPLVSYLTLPVGATKNLPMVLVVHGGPWDTRDDWGYSPITQLLANRGYAVLQVDFRGTPGLGKKFLNAGNGQWGTLMQQDLTDAVQWAINQGIANPKKIAIFGGSYGGYAALAGLTFTPQLYACAVDLAGPTNLQTLLAAIPPIWTTQKKEIYLRVGAVDTNDAFNKKISPLFHIDAIRAPLLIGQGANDPFVNISQAETIVNLMRKKNLPVEYIVYPDEGHGLTRPENRIDFYGRTEEFLAKYLGGRSEPWKQVAGSSAQTKL